MKNATQQSLKWTGPIDNSGKSHAFGLYGLTRMKKKQLYTQK